MRWSAVAAAALAGVCGLAVGGLDANAAARQAEARGTIGGLARSGGFLAGSDYRQFWTRDFGYSLPVLLALGYADAAQAHLRTLLDRQGPDGDLPAMVQTREGMVHGSFDLAPFFRTLRYRGTHVFDHQKELSQEYRHGEADNPVIFVTSAKLFERVVGRSPFSPEEQPRLARLEAYVESIRDGSGLIVGGGWTDAMMNYKGKTLLHTQVWLYKMYEELGDERDMEQVRQALDAFWSDDKGYYADYLGGDHFDTLGNAMMLEEGLVPDSRVAAVIGIGRLAAL